MLMYRRLSYQHISVILGHPAASPPPFNNDNNYYYENMTQKKAISVV